MGATEIQRRMRLNADGSTGGNTASSIALRSLVRGVRQKFQLIMAAPADEREHAFTFRNLNSETSVRVPPLPTTDHEQMFQSEGTFPVPSVLVFWIVAVAWNPVVARVGPVAEMILIVEDAVRFDVAESAPRAAITSSKPQNAEKSLDQRSNQAQEFLLLRSVASCDEKGSDLNVGDLST
jgi:hypothetical protein